MVFAANLLILGWSSVYRMFRNREQELSLAADELANDRYIQEELSIELLRRLIRGTAKLRSVLWWIGLVFGLASATFLYALMLHGAHDVEVCSGFRWFLLMLATYVCPACMLSMAAIGIGGNKIATFLTNGLQSQAETKKNETQDAQTALEQTLKILAQRLK